MSYDITIGYGEEDDCEYDHAHEGTPGAGAPNGGNRPMKNKIALNPTEGFHHSDVYFEPPPEEANVIERILSIRTREPKTDEEKTKYGNTVEEFYVKYKSYSYLHAEWCTFDKLLAGDKRFDGKVKRFRVKQANLMANANVDDELFNPEYTMVDRVLDVATQVRKTLIFGVLLHVEHVLIWATLGQLIVYMYRLRGSVLILRVSFRKVDLPIFGTVN